MSHYKPCRCPKQRIFVFDSPRTCSLLFHRLFEGCDEIQQSLFPFADAATFGPERIIAALDEGSLPSAGQTTEPRWQNETYETAFKRLKDWISSTEAGGKIPWIKDHTFLFLKHDILCRALNNELTLQDHASNPTVLPDNFFYSLTPILLIRHPALAIPSYYRKALPSFMDLPAASDAFKLYTTNRFTRLIFDVYCAKRHVRARADHAGMPIVVDAKESVWETERTVSKLCKMLGLEKEGIKLDWEEVGDEWVGQSECLKMLAPWFLSDVMGAGGVVRSGEKPAEDDLDLNEEQRKLEVEFGKKDAKILRELVDADMPNYEYLRKHTLLSTEKSPSPPPCQSLAPDV